MKVLVDTSVWSLALRRARVQEDPYVLELRAQMTGPEKVNIARQS